MFEDLNELCQISMDQLSLEVKAKQGEKVTLFDLNQLVISLVWCGSEKQIGCIVIHRSAAQR